MTNVYKPYKYKKITIKEFAAKKIFFLIFLNKSVIIGPILIQL